MQKELLKFIIKSLLLLPVFLIIIIFNYFVDPANIFRKQNIEKQIAVILLKGLNVRDVRNYDERLTVKYYVDGLHERKEILVLGSSRVLSINSKFFSDHSFFNNSVSGATIEDDMAIYRMYRKKGMIPSVVIIGLDPWLLNKYNGQTRYNSIQDDYQDAKNFVTKTNTSSKEFLPLKINSEIISLSYFQASFWSYLSSVKKGKKNLPSYSPTKDDIGDENIKLSDGTLSYDKAYRNTSTEDVRKLAISYANGFPSVYSLDKFTQLDPSLMIMFDKFITLLHEDKVEVVFFLPPYHPVAYDILVNSQRYNTIIKAQEYFEEYAKRKKIKVFGSYNPKECSLGEKDFYDGMHQRSESIMKMFKSVSCSSVTLQDFSKSM